MMKSRFNRVSEIVNQYKQPFDAERIAEYVAKKERLTVSEILKKWDAQKVAGCDRGNEIHARIEEYIKGHNVLVPDIVKTVLGMGSVVAFEKRLHCEKTSITGQFDLLLKGGDQKHLLVDWKSNKRIDLESQYGSMRPPFQSFDDCNFNHYQLQQTLYAILIEWYMGIHVDKSFIVHISEEESESKIYEVQIDIWRPLVIQILKERAEQVTRGF